MDYENGWVILDQAERACLASFIQNIQPRYEWDEFIGSLIMVQLWLMNEKHRLVSLDDRTAEDEAGMEKIDMAYVVCAGLMEQAAEVERMGQERSTLH